MYHVLVAEDEPRHRRGIADMIKTLRPDAARIATLADS